MDSKTGAAQTYCWRCSAALLTVPASVAGAAHRGGRSPALVAVLLVLLNRLQRPRRARAARRQRAPSILRHYYNIRDPRMKQLMKDIDDEQKDAQTVTDDPRDRSAATDLCAPRLRAPAVAEDRPARESPAGILQFMLQGKGARDDGLHTQGIYRSERTTFPQRYAASRYRNGSAQQNAEGPGIPAGQPGGRDRKGVEP